MYKKISSSSHNYYSSLSAHSKIMAKRLLLNALVLVLGEFIELNEESLDLAVWSGSIILHDLKLKTETLLRNTDFNILQGKIKSLEIVVPWASLLSSPIKITINGCNHELNYSVECGFLS